MNALAVTLTGSEAAEFSKLPSEVRQQVMHLTPRFREIDTRPNKRRGFAAIAPTLGLSESAVRKKFYAWKAAGCHWSALVDLRKAPESTKKLHPDFIQHWKLLCEQNQRKCKPAYRSLLRAWRAGEEIPGYAIRPQAERGQQVPAGWSYGNLMRHKPSKFELISSRQGRTAAADHRPLVYTTRAKLWVGSHFLFDDMWHDNFVNLLDTRQAGRPLEFHGLDLFSAKKFAWGMRVRQKREDGKQDSLKEADFRFLLAYVLTHFGYHPERGTTLVIEHGTTALSAELEALLHDSTGGMIKVSRGGMQGDPAHIGQYAGRAKGNFRLKAALETLGNLIHNELGALPGQTGLSKETRPEQLHGMLKYNDSLLAALGQLPPERAALLQLPLIEFNQFQAIVSDVYDRINNRIDHKLEGWDAQYLTDPRTGMVRRKSPAEVFQPGLNQLAPVAPEVIALLLGHELGTERSTRRGLIELNDSEISGDVIRFDATALPDREKFLTVLNPFSPDRLICFDARGRYLTTLDRVWSVDRADIEGVQRAMGASAKREGELLAPLRQRHLKEAREKKAMHDQNRQVLANDTPADRERRQEETRIANTVGKAALETIMPDQPETNAEIRQEEDLDEADAMLDQLLED